MWREYLEIVVEHADYDSVEFGRGGTLCHAEVRPTDGIFDKYRQRFRDRAQCSSSPILLRQNPTCQGAVLVDSGRGGEQGTGHWESWDFGETC